MNTCVHARTFRVLFLGGLAARGDPYTDYFWENGSMDGLPLGNLIEFTVRLWI